MKSIERINEEIAKLKSTISVKQARLKELEKIKTEIENGEILSLIRAMNVSEGEIGDLIATLREKKAKEESAT